MRFVLNYNIEDVLITLSVEATTPEEGETKMKRCVSKMLKGFPVGLLFAQATNLFNSQPFLGNQGNQWGGGNTLGGITVPNDGSYVITVGGEVVYGLDGQIHFTNVTTSTGMSGMLTNSSYCAPAIPSAGSFTFTASAGGIGNN